MIEASWNTYVKLPLPWVRTMGTDYWLLQSPWSRHGYLQYSRLTAESYVLRDALGPFITHEARFLDVGCNGGRHLRMLELAGATRGHLAGVDIQKLGDHYPIYCGSFEGVLPLIAARWYTVVFTMGMTVELVPPSFPICHHMARIAEQAVVLMVHETDVPYPRLWKQEFEREGFCQTKYRRCNGASLFVFERQ